MSISSNTTALQEILEIVNNLPETGSGGGNSGGAEAITMTARATGPMWTSGTIYYVDPNGEYKQATSAGTYSVMKGSIIAVKGSGNGTSVSGGTVGEWFQCFGSAPYYYAWYIACDITVSV